MTSETSAVPFILAFGRKTDRAARDLGNEPACQDGRPAVVDTRNGLVLAVRTYSTEVQQETTDDN